MALEACGSAHYWGRFLESHGHRAVLLQLQHVKGYLRGRKNDYNDARAIAEACLHGAIRPVRIKSQEQQDEQAFHAIRTQIQSDSTRLVNQMRGLLAEQVFSVPRTVASFCKRVPELLEDAENGLSSRFRELLNCQLHRLYELLRELAWYDERIQHQARTDDTCRCPRRSA
ncbi:IS110 family transposase, partial [Tamilnaduibacter salinus]|uniref:IS110 family transposase n=1 Tax=Tamilnaduibacter salinus TaxID=1484056 RepID=UPI0013043FDE